MSVYRFISAEQARTSVSMCCELLGVSRSGYYELGDSRPSERAFSDAWLLRAPSRDDLGRWLYGIEAAFDLHYEPRRSTLKELDRVRWLLEDLDAARRVWQQPRTTRRDRRSVSRRFRLARRSLDAFVRNGLERREASGCTTTLETSRPDRRLAGNCGGQSGRVRRHRGSDLAHRASTPPVRVRRPRRRAAERHVLPTSCRIRQSAWRRRTAGRDRRSLTTGERVIWLRKTATTEPPDPGPDRLGPGTRRDATSEQTNRRPTSRSRT